MHFTSLESLPAEFPKEVSVLPGISGQCDAEIDIERGRTRQRAMLSVVATQVCGDKAADEHEVCVP